MKLYNTASRKLEEFKPIKEKQVGMYVCGPTIYDYAHLGHGRSAVNFDLVRRYFLYKGYQVKYIFNYTDIDDKIIKRANEEGITTEELTKKFAKIYDEDYEKLNILPPTKNPRPTDYITQIINIIKKIEKNGFTYELEDGLYFDISKFKKYGKLSHQDIDSLQAGARVEEDEKKKNHQDFVLWKIAKPGEPKWVSPWGEGRPGWHIECSAMASDQLGETFDIHGGGQDLIFPHHENEIAQSEAANKKEFARYWMHNGFIQINKEKMSKSLGNFQTLRDIFQEYDPMEVRYLFISAHYRAPIDFSKESLDQSKGALDRIKEYMTNAKSSKNKLPKELIQKTREEFEKWMGKDFDTPRAIAVIFKFIKEANKLGNGTNGFDLILDLDKVLGLNLEKGTEFEIPKEIEILLKKREEARKNKDWNQSDELRDEIKSKGFIVEDSSEGPKLKKIK